MSLCRGLFFVNVKNVSVEQSDERLRISILVSFTERTGFKLNFLQLDAMHICSFFLFISSNTSYDAGLHY